MSWWHAVLLGALQGVTEFLPISSSGHLVLAQHYFGFETGDSAQEIFFDGVLHLGTLLAVLAYFGREVKAEVGRFFRLTKPARQESQAEGALPATLHPPPAASPSRPWPATWTDLFRLAMLVAVATLPAVAATLVKSDAIQESFKHPRPVAFNFLFLGVVLLATTRLKPGSTTGGEMRWWQAVVVGAAQAASALFRGLSRSGMTISTSLLVGLDRSWAVRFSFLLSIVASAGLGLLGIYKALKDPLRDQWLTSDFLALTFLGTAVSAVVGYLTIGPLIRLVQRARLGWFALYLWLLAAVVLLTA